MKTKLEMAHEYLLRFSGATVADAWAYVDAMQAEADERKPKEPRETHKNLAEFSMYPEFDASINYPPDAWVMYKGEKRLAVSINTEKEWQPDWSQAPEWANWWVAVANQSGKITGGWFYDVKPEFGFGDGPSVYSSMNGNNILAGSFGYTGDWRNSLRKRPK